MATQLEVMQSLHECIVFDAKDYSASKRDAWIYGIIVGWDGPAMRELKAKFGWSDATVERMRALRESWRRTELTARKREAAQLAKAAADQESDGDD